MPTVEQALLAYLCADPVVSNATWDADGHRVYPQRVPQGRAFPAVTFARNAGGERVKAMNTGRDGLAMAMIQVDVWVQSARAYADLRPLANRVGAILDGYPRANGGVQPKKMANMVVVKGVFLEDDPDGIVPPQHGEEQGVETSSLLFKVWYVEEA